RLSVAALNAWKGIRVGTSRYEMGRLEEGSTKRDSLGLPGESSRLDFLGGIGRPPSAIPGGAGCLHAPLEACSAADGGAGGGGPRVKNSSYHHYGLHGVPSQ